MFTRLEFKLFTTGHCVARVGENMTINWPTHTTTHKVRTIERDGSQFVIATNDLRLRVPIECVCGVTATEAA